MKYPVLGSPSLAHHVRHLVVQVSLDIKQDARAHYDLGNKMKDLRGEGVLIIASGNSVHRLRMMVFEIRPSIGLWNLMARSRNGSWRTTTSRFLIIKNKGGAPGWQSIPLSISNPCCSIGRERSA